MKIFIILAILLAFCPIKNTSASQSCFARVNGYNVYLYRSPSSSESLDNKYFAIDRTYFVKITASADDHFYKAEYNGIKGYVKKQLVSFVDGEPNCPYASGISFRIYGDQSRSLRSEPSDEGGSSTLIEYLPLYTTNITYLGAIEGVEVIKERTNVWYYCKYTGEKTLFGYVYSDMCDKMNKVLLNTENMTYIDEPSWLRPSVAETKLSKKNTNIIIGILAVPTGIITFMLIAGQKLLSNKEPKEKARKREISEF